jgi:hypothetical protein
VTLLIDENPIRQVKFYRIGLVGRLAYLPNYLTYRLESLSIT